MQIFTLEETLEKKIIKMEKWMMRLQRELNFLKAVNDLIEQKRPPSQKKSKIVQPDFFAS